MTFNSSATLAGVQAVLEQISYSNTSNSPVLGERLVQLQFTDGNGLQSRSVYQNVKIVAPDAITNIGPVLSYAAGSAPVAIASTAQITDSNNAFSSSLLNVKLAVAQNDKSTDVLSIVEGNNVTVSSGAVSYKGTLIGTVTGGTHGAGLLVTFNTSATQAGIQAVLNQISYSNTSNAPFLGDRGLDLQFTDGNGAATKLTRQDVFIVPVVSITGFGTSVDYVAGSGPVLIASTAHVSDSRNAFANSSLNVQVDSSGLSPTFTDVLSIFAGKNVTVSSGVISYNGTQVGTVTGGTAGMALAITFNSSATQAGVQAVLNQIAYSNTSANPRAGNNDVIFKFTDGIGNTSPFRYVQRVNVVPSAAITGIGSPVTYIHGGSPVAIASSGAIVDTSGAFASSTLAVYFDHAQPSTTTHVLSIVAGNGVTVVSGVVSVNGTQIGTVTGGMGGKALSVKFNSSATQAGEKAVLNQIAYSNTDSTLNNGDVGFFLQFIDGNGSISSLVHQVVHIK